ncbi:MAG: hypothetical protein ACREX7_04270 [Casimicrobiaceae bacterium]
MACAAFVTKKLWLTLEAAAYAALPACDARIVHVPAATMVRVAPLILQVAGVSEAKVTTRPEDAEALIVDGAAPKIFPVSAGKLIVWLLWARAGREAANQRVGSSNGTASVNAIRTRLPGSLGRSIDAIRRFSGRSLGSRRGAPAILGRAATSPRIPASYRGRFPLCSWYFLQDPALAPRVARHALPLLPSRKRL